MFIFDGNEIETDSEGYLKDTTQWNEAMAAVIAEQEGISLSVEHWEVVRFVRDFYLEFNTSPAIRMLVKAMAKQLWRRERQQPLSLPPVSERPG
ncbi:sulfur transfer protein TusE [Klebsiella michiganensis]|nr:sulfur transfer protein TusE [Klebsiella michiganensis]